MKPDWKVQFRYQPIFEPIRSFPVTQAINYALNDIVRKFNAEKRVD